MVDTDTTVSGPQSYNGDLSITDTGSITFQPNPGDIYVDGSLNNAGSINSAESVHVSSELNNSGSIMSKGERVNVRGNSIVNQKGGSISLNGTDYADIDADGTLENGGSISLNGTVYAYIDADGTLENGGSIMSKGERVNVYGDSIVNREDGSISINGTVYADIFVYGTLENSGSIEISSSGTAAILTNKLENHGTVSVTGARVAFANDVENYNTITLTEKGVTKTYYGVNYVDENGGVTTVLDNWEDGEAGRTVSLKLKDNSETREGYNFFWQVGNDKYQAGSTLGFVVSGVTNIKALWDKIAAPAGSATVAELFEKQIEARVFDAERNELQQGEDYDCVFYTSLGRRVVQFTPEQLEAMEAGAHLFYILDENDVEWEYTIVKG